MHGQEKLYTEYGIKVSTFIAIKYHSLLVLGVLLCASSVSKFNSYLAIKVPNVITSLSIVKGNVYAIYSFPIGK